MSELDPQSKKLGRWAMAKCSCEVEWKRVGEGFLKSQYSREHVWRFDGGISVSASSSPSIVPLPYSRVDAVDPEEAYVASISSCHMLWFLSIAAKEGFVVDSYSDQAMGSLGQTKPGEKPWITKVILRPKTTFSGEAMPSREQLEALHNQAHAECFIANSVKTEIVCEVQDIL